MPPPRAVTPKAGTALSHYPLQRSMSWRKLHHLSSTPLSVTCPSKETGRSVWGRGCPPQGVAHSDPLVLLSLPPSSALVAPPNWRQGVGPAAAAVTTGHLAKGPDKQEQNRPRRVVAQPRW